MSLEKKYLKGSEWHRWDLHVHTPKSIIQNFGGDTPENWNKFITKIKELPKEVKVLGITDYLFCDGYEYLLRRKNEIPNIDLIIPNIEFRLNTFSGTQNNTKRHNFHILFSPEVDVQTIREQLLNCLSTGYKISDNSEWLQTPTYRSLQELGKQMKSVAPSGMAIHSKTDLIAGFESITYKREDIEKLLQKTCFKGKFVIAMGYSEWDQSRWDQSASEKRNLINSTNFCLTSQTDPIKIENNIDKLKIDNLNSLVLQSSDAHDFDKIGQSLLWIKADPTFSGLKQVLNEPESRVFIGQSEPNLKQSHKIISKLSINNSNGWFPDSFSIELNQDLVSIIGGRGSGKSALAEAIAFGAGVQCPKEDSFFEKASKHITPIKGAKVKLEWASGEITEFEVGRTKESSTEFVRYLSQGAVEDLCSHKNSEKLQKQIENVIFQSIDESRRMGASDFEELKNTTLNEFEYEKEKCLLDIKSINHQTHLLNEQIKSVPAKEKEVREKEEELALLRKSIPSLPSDDLKGQQELSSLLELEKIFEKRLSDLYLRINKIPEIESKIKIFNDQIQNFKQDVNTLIESVSLTNRNLVEISINDSQISKFLVSKRNSIENEIKKLTEGEKTEVATILDKSVEDLPFANFKSLKEGIEQKRKETKAFESEKLKYQQQSKLIVSTQASINNLKDEIDKIKNDVTPKKVTLEDKRIKLFCEYFSLIKQEKQKMEVLYAPLQETLKIGSDTDKKLVFEARISCKLDHHLKKGLNLIDRSRKGPFRKIEDLDSVLKETWLTFELQDFSDKAIKDGILNLQKQFENLDGENILIEDQLKEGYCLEDFNNWIFDPTNITTTSAIKFEDTDLTLLSPGQKGIILLMLFLEIDKADCRPLIVDQPEENLDNLSVYTDLIHYFKERKKYRQIIMVTHNPNLVVNTDSEQIVIANYNGKRIPRLEYCSGSLENKAQDDPHLEIKELTDGIIEQVCNVLEGGNTAFNNRKKKYLLSPKIS